MYQACSADQHPASLSHTHCLMSSLQRLCRAPQVRKPVGQRGWVVFLRSTSCLAIVFCHPVASFHYHTVRAQRCRGHTVSNPVPWANPGVLWQQLSAVLGGRTGLGLSYSEAGSLAVSAWALSGLLTLVERRAWARESWHR